MSVMPCEEPGCDEGEGEAAIELIVEGRPTALGTLSLARILPSVRHRTVGPFVFIDHLGPIDLPPGGGYDILPHPHIGLTTVTYFYEGQNVHRDSLGTVQVNRPGDLNLMTAGRGVVHSERADPAWRDHGGRLHGLQLWLGLPAANEEDAPSFEHHPAASLPEFAPASGIKAQVLLGELDGRRSPVRHPSQPSLVDLKLELGARFELPADGLERAVLVVEGAAKIGAASASADRLVVFRPGATATVEATAPGRLLVVGGPPLDGPRHLDWNFVSSRVDRLQRAVLDWKTRSFPAIPGDAHVFVPYPDRPHSRSALGRST